MTSPRMTSSRMTPPRIQWAPRSRPAAPARSPGSPRPASRPRSEPPRERSVQLGLPVAQSGAELQVDVLLQRQVVTTRRAQRVERGHDVVQEQRHIEVVHLPEAILRGLADALVG